MKKIIYFASAFFIYLGGFAQTESECDDYAANINATVNAEISYTNLEVGMIEASSVNDYSADSNITQKWIFYSSSNPDSGPYTSENIGFGSSYSSPNIQESQYYFLVHKVSVESCGIEACTGFRVQIETGNRMSSSWSLENCGDLPEGIEYDSPTITSVDEDIQQITWDVVPEASAYSVEITSIGETDGEAFSTTTDFTTTDTSYTYTADPDVEEIIIRVRSMSAEGNKSLPSDEINIDLTGSMSIDPVEAFASEAKIYPNPSKGDFSIELNTKLSGNANFSIYSTQGRLVEQKSVSLGTDRNIVSWENASLSPGLYFVVIESEKEKKTIKLIME